MVTHRLNTLDAWKEKLWSTYVRLESKSEDAGFYGKVREYFRGGSGLSSVESTAQLTERAHAHIHADSQEVFLIAFQVHGQGSVDQDGRIAETNPGEFVIYDSTRPYRLQFKSPFKQLVFRASYDTLQSRAQGLRNLCARSFQAREGASGIALDFLKSLARRAEEIDPREMRAIGNIASDLVVNGILSQTNDLPPRYRLFEKLRNAISEEVRNPEFGSAELASMSGMSPRSLRRLCAENNASPARVILNARLQGARRDLATGSKVRKSITEIALDWGFSDISHFNRSFKAAFGYTPSMWRRMHNYPSLSAGD
ncbi:helix-turn-helix domain-containing protein [Agrobacterium tumefaciens]|uniref:helix-turn-helix domain-containing protein n=1 Tax=Agrobacterium tumefaciens TaxID=358 RepID=UPI001573BDA8|nr:helix-turn-helix domain-containing protein [Agrobacterium tumefaciens]UXT20481.1 helix-turn-helix domain-containing protein [Agrobacterium tumefaciens]WHO20728.1 helix-turn-helix domain-containing protein [Agrobacterium tumefaciens]WHO23513.1 helix-turn-helix domain-containing protein [Agrobacterium tumefaciens]